MLKRVGARTQPCFTPFVTGNESELSPLSRTVARIPSCNKAVRQSPDLLFIATSFWFEESPCAVRTNTAGLGRLCTLFVCSTLLVFEHMHAVLSSTLVLCCTMVTTSTAAMSNSRYADTDRMKNVFLIRFSKPHLDRTKAGRRANACRLEGFTIASIKKDTYMCSLNLSVILCSL